MTGSDKSFLFVCGVPRSGTTALTELLGRHRDAAIGIERYKKLLGVPTQHLLTPALFERERFFDVRDSDTNLMFDGKHKDHYDDLTPRFDDARVFGDKVPTYYYLYHHLLGVFPDCRVVCILRDPYEVGSSWNTRAHNPADRWRPDEDARRSVVRWNECLQICLRARSQYPDDFLVVEHGRLFGGDMGLFVTLSEAVGLPVGDDDRARFADTCARWSEVKHKPLALDADELAAVGEAADLDLYEQLTGTRIARRSPGAPA